MARMKLTFPVFYHCAVKGACALQQYHCVNVLLTGKLKADDSISISESTASVYVNGAKPLPKDLIRDLLHLPSEEIVRRFRELNYFDVSAIADAVARLLDMVDISPSARDELLRARQGENAYAFLCEVFRSALRNPAPTVRLTVQEKAAVRLCRNGATAADDPQDDLSKQTVSSEPSETQPDTAETADTESAASQYERQRRELLRVYEYTAETPQQLSNLFDLCVEKMVNQPSMIDLDHADVAAILPREPDEYAVFLECFGNSEEIDAYIRSTTYFKDALSALIYISGSESIGLEEIIAITDSIQDRCMDDTNIMFGFGLDESMVNGNLCLYLSITLRRKKEQAESEEPSGPCEDTQSGNATETSDPEVPEEPDENEQFPLNLFK